VRSPAHQKAIDLGKRLKVSSCYVAWFDVRQSGSHPIYHTTDRCVIRHVHI
jgi:hypothetical protein